MMQCPNCHGTGEVSKGLSQKELNDFAAHYPFPLAEFTKCHAVLIPLMEQYPKGNGLTVMDIKSILTSHAILQVCLNLGGLDPNKILRMVKGL